MPAHSKTKTKTKQMKLGASDVQRLAQRFHGVTHIDFSFCPVRAGRIATSAPFN